MKRHYFKWLYILFSLFVLFGCTTKYTCPYDPKGVACKSLEQVYHGDVKPDPNPWDGSNYEYYDSSIYEVDGELKVFYTTNLVHPRRSGDVVYEVYIPSRKLADDVIVSEHYIYVVVKKSDWIIK